MPEELFQKIKDYLQRNNMTQKQFVIGLIENEIERDLSQRADMNEAPIDTERVVEEHTERQETAAMSDCEGASEEVGEQPEEQESTDFSDDFDDESEESENFDEDEEFGRKRGSRRVRGNGNVYGDVKSCMLSGVGQILVGKPYQTEKGLDIHTTIYYNVKKEAVAF